MNIEDLQRLKEKNLISEEDFLKQKRRLVNNLLSNKFQTSACNGIVYILLAFFLGAIGVHNFYARYYKRGFIQFLLALISPFMMYVPLMFTSIMAMLELMFINKSANGKNFKGNRKLVWFLRILIILVFVVCFSISDTLFGGAQIDIAQDF